MTSTFLISWLLIMQVIALLHFIVGIISHSQFVYAWLAPKIFRSYQGVLWSHIRRTHHRYHERLYEDADSVIVIPFQRGSLSTRYRLASFVVNSHYFGPARCFIYYRETLNLLCEYHSVVRQFEVQFHGPARLACTVSQGCTPLSSVRGTLP